MSHDKGRDEGYKLRRLDSILGDTVEAVKQFLWDTVLMEFEKMLPTLLTLLKNLIPKTSEHDSPLCLIAYQLLKLQENGSGTARNFSHALWKWL